MRSLPTSSCTTMFSCFGTCFSTGNFTPVCMMEILDECLRLSRYVTKILPIYLRQMCIESHCGLSVASFLLLWEWCNQLWKRTDPPCMQYPVEFHTSTPPCCIQELPCQSLWYDWMMVRA